MAYQGGKAPRRQIPLISTPYRPQQLYDAREKTVQEIADLFNIPRGTLYGYLDRRELA